MNLQATERRPTLTSQVKRPRIIGRAPHLTSHARVDASSTVLGLVRSRERGSTTPLDGPADLSATLAWVAANRAEYLGK